MAMRRRGGKSHHRKHKRGGTWANGTSFMNWRARKVGTSKRGPRIRGSKRLRSKEYAKSIESALAKLR